MELERTNVERSFGQYTAAYNAEDPKIRLKIDHTYRVAGLCEAIAGSVKDADPDLAWLTGMLHDIGRFEQVRRYGTFFDAESVDHAAFGADLLFCEGLLDTLVPGYPDRMTEKELAILEKSVRFHSLFRLPDDLDEPERLYCDILRDADKIDIYRVNCDTPPEDIYNVSTRELKEAGVSDEVKECFRNRTAVFRPLRKTAADYLVGHICLVFELRFPVSRRIVREQGYIDRMLAFHSDNPDTKAWFAYMKNELEKT